MGSIFRYINPLYILAIVLGIWLYSFATNSAKQPELFFGFAQNNETEINLDYPVQVNELFVSEGQMIEKGISLINLSQLELSKEIQDEELKISELSTNFKGDKRMLEGELLSLEMKKKEQILELDNELAILQEKINQKSALYKDLKTIDFEIKPDQETLQKIEAIKTQKAQLNKSFDVAVENKKSQISNIEAAYFANVKRHKSDVLFNQTKLEKLTLKSPHRGMIGNVHVKAGEYLPSFKPLITLYEPNPSQVIAYVHESLLVKVNVGDKFIVQSMQDENNKFEGQVVGLGSRIVEIPERLRKMPDLKTYGREVVIKIPVDNSLLQKEKVKILFPQNLQNNPEDNNAK